MDIRIYSFICVAYIAMLHTAEGGCKEEKEADDNYKECLSAYKTYITGVAQSGGTMSDPSQMMGLLCSEEGQSATSCMQEHVKECSELAASDQTLSIFTVVEQMGGCGGPVMAGGECTTAMQECMGMEGMGGAGEDPSIADAPTEFHKFQEQIKTICVGLKSKFECLKKHEKKCPKLENQLKTMMEQGMKQSNQSGPVSAMATFDTQKKFVMEQCPKFPEDFTTSACIKDNLAKTSFTDCYKNATKKYKGQPTCDAIKDAYPCVTTALEGCGEEYTTAFMATTNFYLGLSQKDCKITKETSSGNVYFVSFYTIIIGFVLTYAF